MRTVTIHRKLAAIFSADAQGYSRLMGENEEATIQTLTAHRQVMTQLIRHYRGKVVDFPGDNLLATFSSVMEAVQCAVATQRALHGRNALLPANRAMAFRIGIHLGDVLVDGERIYGEGVNLAARLEGLAEAGGVCISGPVYDQVEGKLDLDYVDLGERLVKNIAKPVRVYRIETDAAVSTVDACTPTPPQPALWQQVSKGTAGSFFPSLGRAAQLWVSVRHRLRTPLREEMPKQRAVTVFKTPTLMVVPFDNPSGHPADEDFCTGLTEVLVTDLTKLTGALVVVDRSVPSVATEWTHIRQICQRWGARYLLQGSVRQSNHRVRITAQLIDVVSGHHVWADRYDRDLYDLFALQDDITEKIVTALSAPLKQHAPCHSVPPTHHGAWSLAVCNATT